MTTEGRSHASPGDKPAVDVHERGLPKDGVPQRMDRRLYVKLTALEGPTARAIEPACAAVLAAARAAGAALVVYQDVQSPRTLALVTFSDDPTALVRWDRALHAVPELDAFRPRNELAMIGRTYSSGYENDLAFWLLKRPVDTLLHEGWDWGIFYPLRRKGEFNRLPREEQGKILREHGEIGRAYGELDLAHDLRLACHGLDTNDNDFVIGLIGKDLHPLSHVVQSMRGTRQTAELMEQMGPFFVGRVLGRNAGVPLGGE